MPTLAAALLDVMNPEGDLPACVCNSSPRKEARYACSCDFPDGPCRSWLVIHGGANPRRSPVRLSRNPSGVVFFVERGGAPARRWILTGVREIMRSKKPYRKRKPVKSSVEQLCSAAWAEDGVDPRYDQRGQAPRPTGRKALQLCAQVKEALEAALAADCGDSLLQELNVATVQPAPNSARLLVMVRPPADVGASQVMEHLSRAAGKLRCEVAASICRKKVPELAFCVVAPEARA